MKKTECSMSSRSHGVLLNSEIGPCKIKNDK